MVNELTYLENLTIPEKEDEKWRLLNHLLNEDINPIHLPGPLWDLYIKDCVTFHGNGD